MTEYDDYLISSDCTLDTTVTTLLHDTLNQPDLMQRKQAESAVALVGVLAVDFVRL